MARALRKRRADGATCDGREYRQGAKRDELVTAALSGSRFINTTDTASAADQSRDRSRCAAVLVHSPRRRREFSSLAGNSRTAVRPPRSSPASRECVRAVPPPALLSPPLPTLTETAVSAVTAPGLCPPCVHRPLGTECAENPSAGTREVRKRWHATAADRRVLCVRRDSRETQRAACAYINNGDGGAIGNRASSINVSHHRHSLRFGSVASTDRFAAPYERQ